MALNKIGNFTIIKVVQASHHQDAESFPISFLVHITWNSPCYMVFTMILTSACFKSFHFNLLSSRAKFKAALVTNSVPLFISPCI